MTDTVRLGQTTDVLDEISTFREKHITFTLDCINKNRTQHGLHEISCSKALNAIMCAFQQHSPEMSDEEIAHILAGFFGPHAATMDIEECDSSVDELYVQLIADLNEASTLTGPRGPSLGCVYQDTPVGIYLYATVLAKRFQDKATQ